MRKILLAALMLPTLALNSCSKSSGEGMDNPPGTTMVTIKADTNQDVILKSRAMSPAPFWLTITGPDGYLLERTLGTETKIKNISAGQYTVTLINRKDYTLPAINTPIYKATQTNEVAEGTNTVFSLVCRQINAGVRYSLDNNVTAFYTGLTIRMEDKADASKVIEFDKTNTDAGDIAYFDVPSTLVLSLSNNGEVVNINGQAAIEIDVAERELWTITLKTIAGEGVTVEASVDDSTIDKDPEYGIGDVFGEGTEASPYSVADAVNTMPANGVWVEGYITGTQTVTRSGGNSVLIGTKPDALESKCLILRVPTGSQLEVLLDPTANGKKVKLFGDVIGKSDFVTNAYAVMENVTDFDYEARDTGLHGVAPITLNGKTFKDVAKGPMFRMGATVKTDYMFGAGSPEVTPLYMDLIARDFTSLTMEYEMKMDQQVKLNNGEQTYRKQWHDQFKEYIRQNGIDLHGHTLIWYKDIPSGWEALSADQLKANVEEFFRVTMVDNYPMARSWDVVNEAIYDWTGNWEGDPYRDCLWKTVYGGGKEYVRAMYEIARKIVKENGLSCKLFYNDYGNEFNPQKRDAIIKMVKTINAEYAADNNGEVLIDGIGMQMHLYVNRYDQTDIEAAFDTALETGLLIHVSELSVGLFESESASVTITEDMRRKQLEMFNTAIDMAFAKVPADRLWGITTWGLNDGTSIYKNRQAMLFDSNWKAKRPYFSIINKYAK